MLPWNKLTIIRNRYRAHELREFRKWVEVYFEQSARDADDVVFDVEGARAARSHLNRMLPRVVGVVRAAGLGGFPASIAATDPGLGLDGVDALHRIFTARDAGVDQEIFDVLDMAIGVYDGDQAPALLRLVNPLYYAGRMLAFVGTGPRRFFEALGFRRRPAFDEGRLAGLEALAARYAEAERRMESRFSVVQDHHARDRVEQARELAELAERVDFVERVLAAPRPGGAIRPPREHEEGLNTPV